MKARAPHLHLGVWQVVAVLAAFLVSRYAQALRAPFFSDDYIFFDKLAEAPFRVVWQARDLAYQWYRPWSRELHYWVFFRLFHLNPLPYHLAAFVLWLAALTCYWTLANRIAGRVVATIACAGVAALAAWSVLLEWSPGVQDLWMLVFAFASLLAFAWRRNGWATAALVLALLSKETAASVPAIALGYAMLVDRDRPRAALARIVPLAAVVGLWALVHPALGGRWWWAGSLTPLRPVAASPIAAGIRSLLAIVNLDLSPQPMSGWGRAMLTSLPGAIVLAGAVAFVAFRHRSAGVKAGTSPPSRAAEISAEAVDLRESRPDGGVIAFGILWAVAGLLPLFAPSVLWQSYYTLFGAFGAWLALAVVMARAPAVAAAAVFVMAMFSGVRSDTPSHDWGNAQLQRFGKSFMAQTESYLRWRFPTMPRHTRLYFTAVPRGVVFVTGPNDAPALRVWFSDPTVMGSFWSDYRRRTARDPMGDDFFFRYDSQRGWLEVVKGPENLDSMRALDPEWRAAHERLARILIQAGDLDGAGGEFEKLSGAYRQNAEYAFLAGMAHEARGDSAAAGPWYERAARLPGADADMRSKAKRFGGHR